ncbi:MAG: ORF6C domain-containing protein [Streptococcus sp.]|uniref:ORF6C domain-containing protein n=1 Tax=Streptococcus sp. TaxID=1306 RepID=UPI0025853833|nr:ORF6C domain-containing protein [Streptococcus sp.]MCR5493074.1 ORF6C domain-containing protein [Streptococcus sp.]
MNDIFEFHGYEVRTMTIDGEPYFSNADVCRVLEINNPSQALKRLKQDGVISNEVIDSLGRKQSMKFVSENNLYKLIFQSKKKEAEAFTDWVTSEVLPTIRRQGVYINKNLSEDAFINLFQNQKKIKLEQASMKRDIDYLKEEQPIHPSHLASLEKKRKQRVVTLLGGTTAGAYLDKDFSRKVFWEAGKDFKEHFKIGRYDMLPKKCEYEAFAYWSTWEPSTNTRMKIQQLNSQIY